MATGSYRIILSNMDQLKCNFCTKWFSVDSKFAQMQRYSLNACTKCFDQFHHTLVHPETLDIYEIAFMKTGITLQLGEVTNKREQMAKADSEIRRKWLLKKQDIEMAVQLHLRSIKEKFSEVCKKLLAQTIQFSNNGLSEIDQIQKEISGDIEDILRKQQREESQKVLEFDKLHLQLMSKVSQSQKLNGLKVFLKQFIKDKFEDTEQNSSKIKFQGRREFDQAFSNMSISITCPPIQAESMKCDSECPNRPNIIKNMNVEDFHQQKSFSMSKSQYLKVKMPQNVSNKKNIKPDISSCKNMKQVGTMNLKNIRQRVVVNKEKQEADCPSVSMVSSSILSTQNLNNMENQGQFEKVPMTIIKNKNLASNSKSFLEKSSKRKYSTTLIGEEFDNCKSNLKRQASSISFRQMKESTSCKSPRPVHLDSDNLSQYQSVHAFDECRQKVGKMLKDKNYFLSYCFKNKTLPNLKNSESSSNLFEMENKENMNPMNSKKQSMKSSRVSGTTSNNQLNPNQIKNGKTYGEKPLIQKIIQLKQQATFSPNSCELINANLSYINGNISCLLKYLEKQNNMRNDKSRVQILKMVKVHMHDTEFDHLLHWLEDMNELQVLVLTNNMLSEASIHGLVQFFTRNVVGSTEQFKLKDVYLGNNYIKLSKVKKQVEQLRRYGCNVHI